jgi:hypothetical protein
MAKGDLMLQIAVEQSFSSAVHDVPDVWAVAIDFLDGDRTIVREIASEKDQGFFAMSNNDFQFGIFGLSDTVATDLWLASNDLRRPPVILHAPSHVPSPPIDGATVVLLRVRDFGFTITTSSAPGVALGRIIGSHAYLEEVKA